MVNKLVLSKFTIWGKKFYRFKNSISFRDFVGTFLLNMKRNTRSGAKEEVCDMCQPDEPEAEEVVVPSPRRDIQWTVSLERWKAVIYGGLLVVAFVMGAGCTHLKEVFLPNLLSYAQIKQIE